MEKQWNLGRPAQPGAHDSRRASPVLLALFAVVLVAGAALYFTREARIESAAYSSISACNAKLDANYDGLNDNYALVSFDQNRDAVAHLFTLCARSPETALRIFRRSLDEGNKSAKMIAISTAFFIAMEKRLADEDFKRLVARMHGATEPDADVRRVAQRAVSDLTVIASPANSTRYEIIPENTPPSGEKDAAHKIETHGETLGKQAYLSVRWSNPVLAEAWWKQYGAQGRWDAELQRFVIP